VVTLAALGRACLAVTVSWTARTGRTSSAATARVCLGRSSSAWVVWGAVCRRQRSVTGAWTVMMPVMRLAVSDVWGPWCCVVLTAGALVVSWSVTDSGIALMGLMRLIVPGPHPVLQVSRQSWAQVYYS